MSGVGIVRWGNGGGVSMGAFTGPNQTGPASGNLDARGFQNWNFQIEGTITAGGVTVQGTTDGNVWFDLVPPSQGTSTGADVNPIAAIDAQLMYKGPLWAVRGVSNAAFAGSVILKGFAVP